MGIALLELLPGTSSAPGIGTNTRNKSQAVRPLIQKKAVHDSLPSSLPFLPT